MQTIFTKLGEAILTMGVVIAGLFGFTAQPAQSPNVGATIPVSVAVFQTSLASSITSSATSMTLVNGTDKSGDAISGYICFNIDEGTSLEEFVCGTASGTSVTSMIRGIDPVDGDLEVTALKKAHRRGASVKVTNYPSLAILSRILNGNETIPNILTYASAPTFTTGSNQLASIKYADDLAIAGAPDASTIQKGIAEEATEAEINSGTAAGGTSARLFINPSTLLTSSYGLYLPSSGQKDALAGTSGTPSSSNKYVTSDDVASAKTASKIARRDSNSDLLVATTPTAGDAATSKTYVDTAITGVTAIFKNGQTTRDLSTASGTQTIAHGVGSTPSKIRLTVIQAATSGALDNYSFGAYNGSTTTNVYRGQNSNSQYYVGGGTTDCITIYTAATTDTSPSTATCTMDATNITLTWTKAGSASGTAYIMWEAEK